MRRSVGVAVAVMAALLAGCWHTEPVTVPPGWTSPPPRPLQTGPIVTVDPHLPSAQPLPAGLLESTDSTWFVARLSGVDGASRDVVRAYDLISPGGARYQIRDVTDTSLDQWLPGTALALGFEDTISGSVNLVVVDLETGAVVARPKVPALRDAVLGDEELDVTFVGDGTTDLLLTVRSQSAGRMVRVSLDGTIRASLDGTLQDPLPGPRGDVALAADPDSGRVVVLDLATFKPLAEPLADQFCVSGRWLDATRWLAYCTGDVETWLVVDGETSWLVTQKAVAAVAGLAPDVDEAALLSLSDWGDDGLARTTVVRASPSGTVEVDKGQAWVWGPVGSAVLGSPVVPDGADAWGAPYLEAPVTAWHPTDATTTVLVPTPERGVTQVVPLRQIGEPMRGSLGTFPIDTLWYHPAF